MLSNNIVGVKPFNEFWFKSCYYHQLVAGLSCFGITHGDFLVNSMVFIERDFLLDTTGILGEKEFEKFFGYTCRRCNITEKSLVKRIDKGCPVIVGVDCFYLESRSDTYRITHAPHFILAYGYDLEKREVNVVDHIYRNSFEYSKKTISLDNLLWANAMYKKKPYQKRITCRVLRKRGKAQGKNILLKLDGKRLEKSRKNSLENLGEMKRMFAEDLPSLAESAERIINYLQNIKTSLYCVSKIEIFERDAEKKFVLFQLIGAYSNILSLFWKMFHQQNFEFCKKHSDSILRKIEAIEEAEEKVYHFLEEACG